MQACDRFRGGGEGGIAGCRVPALARFDELDLVRVQAAHGSYGQLAAWRAGRVRLGYRFGGRVQRGVLGVHVGQRGGAVRGRELVRPSSGNMTASQGVTASSPVCRPIGHATGTGLLRGASDP
jgi:hypothetical protein